MDFLGTMFQLRGIQKQLILPSLIYVYEDTLHRIVGSTLGHFRLVILSRFDTCKCTGLKCRVDVV